jgi:hypothetical protein
MVKFQYLYKIKNKLKSENNSQFSKKSIHNNITWKWVRKEEDEKYLNTDWKLSVLKLTKEN